MRELPTPISVEEALTSADFNIDVPEGTTLTVGPFEEQYSEAFRLAAVTSFEDFHRLGYIPKDIDETQMVSAMRADDRIFRESLQGRVMRDEAPCSCEGQHTHVAAHVSRRHFQNNLIELLQPLYRDALGANDSAVLHPYHHARAWLNRGALFLVGLYSITDINIGDNATLTLTPTVQALYAHEINIGKNGHLRFTSGNVHVRCGTLNGPNPFASETFDKYVPGLSREKVNQ